VPRRVFWLLPRLVVFISKRVCEIDCIVSSAASVSAFWKYVLLSNDDTAVYNYSYVCMSLFTISQIAHLARSLILPAHAELGKDL
jgi:hypothetical protein